MRGTPHPAKRSTLGLGALNQRRRYDRSREKNLKRAFDKGVSDRARGVKFTQAPYYKDANMYNEWVRGWEEQSAKQANSN